MATVTTSEHPQDVFMGFEDYLVDQADYDTTPAFGDDFFHLESSDWDFLDNFLNVDVTGQSAMLTPNGSNISISSVENPSEGFPESLGPALSQDPITGHETPLQATQSTSPPPPKGRCRKRKASAESDGIAPQSQEEAERLKKRARPGKRGKAVGHYSCERCRKSKTKCTQKVGHDCCERCYNLNAVNCDKTFVDRRERKTYGGLSMRAMAAEHAYRQSLPQSSHLHLAPRTNTLTATATATRNNLVSPPPSPGVDLNQGAPQLAFATTSVFEYAT